MVARQSTIAGLPRLALALALFALAACASGCADMSDNMTAAFADPAKYDLYSCKQLETERKALNTKSAELQGLIDKAQTTTGGTVVAELAYRNEYVAVRGQSHFLEQTWRKNRCRESPPGSTEASDTSATPGAGAKQGPTSKSGSAVY
jgi:hypothetical protein